MDTFTITKTFIVKTNLNVPFDSFKEGCLKIGLVKDTKFKNSFILRLDGITIRCSKGGSFTFTGLLDEDMIMNRMLIILNNVAHEKIVMYIIPAMHNIKKTYRITHPLDLDHVLNRINKGEGMFAYRLPKSPGLNIKYKVNLDSVPITKVILNNENGRYVMDSNQLCLLKDEFNVKKDAFVTISLFKSGKVIFSGIHKVCLDMVMMIFEDLDVLGSD
jgi:hypothetical protein